MVQQSAFYLYGEYVISTLREEGVWWATARPPGKGLGGERPVLGGPWRTEGEAVAAAQAFCDSGKAGFGPVGAPGHKGERNS